MSKRVEKIRAHLAKAEGFVHHPTSPMSLAWTCVHDILTAYDTVCQERDAAVAKLQSQAYVCSTCWTNSYEPCAQETPEALEQTLLNPNTGEHEKSWWRCLCCRQTKLLLEQTAKLDAILREKQALVGKLQGQACLCQLCWTNSYEPCEKGTPDAIQRTLLNPDTGEYDTTWWRCLCCWQTKLLLEQKAKLTDPIYQECCALREKAEARVVELETAIAELLETVRE